MIPNDKDNKFKEDVVKQLAELSMAKYVLQKTLDELHNTVREGKNESRRSAKKPSDQTLIRAKDYFLLIFSLLAGLLGFLSATGKLYKKPILVEKAVQEHTESIRELRVASQDTRVKVAVMETNIDAIKQTAARIETKVDKLRGN